MAKKDKPNRGSLGNQLINKLISSIDPSYNSNINLNEKNEDFKKIINDELALTKGISQGSIVDFARALNSDKAKPNPNGTTRDPNDTLDLFKYITMNAASIYNAYNDANRNKFIEMQDLQFIAKFVPSLGQCVKIALTHIVSSDDLSGVIQRIFDYGQSIDSEDAGIVTKALETFETENKLLKKLKNVYRSTLVSGNYYVYAVSYKKLFTEYDNSLKARKNASGYKGFRADTAKESVTVDEFEYTSQSIALESADITAIGNALSPVSNEKLTDEELEFKRLYTNNLATFEYIESPIPLPILDTIPAFEHYESAIEAAGDNASDGTYTMEGSNRFNIAGTYLKFINARNVIPIMALDEIVAYLYVEPKRDKTKQNSVEVTIGQLSNIKKENAAEKAANLMAAKLEKVFSEKFVSQHTNFKKIIADCIMANGTINTDYKIQVIPVDDMIPFTVGENDDGRGTSMLAESLFPAKLLTNIMIKKNLNYVNKSGDRTVAFVKRGKSDIHGSNQTMRVIRGLQESQVTFQDMFNSSMVFHKFASDGNIVLPQSMSGNRLVEFEKMEGQDVNLGTDYEKYLENLAIVGTHIPPLIIEQINNADFAKAYTTAHAGFAGVVAEWQSDLEYPTTLLYKKIIQNLDIDESIKQRVLPTFEFKLPRPKALSNSNTNENLSNALQLAETFINLKFGESTEENKNAYNAAKYAVVKARCPFIKWDELEQVADKAMMESGDIKDDTPKDDSLMGGNDDDDDDF